MKPWVGQAPRPFGIITLSGSQAEPSHERDVYAAHYPSIVLPLIALLEYLLNTTVFFLLLVIQDFASTISSHTDSQWDLLFCIVQKFMMTVWCLVMSTTQVTKAKWPSQVISFMHYGTMKPF